MAIRRHQDVQNLIDHIYCGWGHSDEVFRASPWILSTSDLNWAIWEVARRLSRGTADWVAIAVLEGPRHDSLSSHGVKLVTVDAVAILEEVCQMCLCAYHTQKHAKALNFARSSSEFLWCGRIPPRHVLGGYRFSRNATNMSVPEWCLVPKKRRTGCWYFDVVWTPGVDSYYAAKEKMDVRWEQIQISRMTRSSST